MGDACSSEAQNTASLLKILTSVVYRSRPVRWRTRRTLEQEKAKLERYLHEFEQLSVLADADQKERAELQKLNQEFLTDLSVLVESFRATVFDGKEGLEQLKERNEKLLRALKKQAAEKLAAEEKHGMQGKNGAKNGVGKKGSTMNDDLLSSSSGATSGGLGDGLSGETNEKTN